MPHYRLDHCVSTSAYAAKYMQVCMHGRVSGVYFKCLLHGKLHMCARACVHIQYAYIFTVLWLHGELGMCACVHNHCTCSSGEHAAYERTCSSLCDLVSALNGTCACVHVCLHFCLLPSAHDVPHQSTGRVRLCFFH